MDKQTREAKRQTKELPIRERIENFWYYNKTKCILGFFALILLVFTAIEFINITEYDMNISYYSASPISNEGLDAVKEVLRNEIVDINNNVAVDIGMIATYADPERANEQTKATLMRLQAELAAGNSAAYLIDEKYKRVLEENFSEVIENILDITELKNIKEMLGLDEDEKLYWMTRRVYFEEQNNSKKLAEHENALRIENFLKGLISKQ